MLIASVLSGLLLAVALPAAATCPDLYRCAAEAARTGDETLARTLAEKLVAEQPENADALLLLGNLALRDGRLDDAQATLDRAALVAPAYPDVFAARARLALRRANPARARAELAKARTLGSAEVSDIERQLNSQLHPARWSIALQHGVSDVSRRGVWHETVLTVTRAEPRAGISLEAEHSRRFGLSDLRFQFRADARLSQGTVYVSAVGTVDADFREDWGLRAGGELQASRWLDLVADGRISNYGAINTESLAVGGRLWLPNRRASFQASLINLWDETGTHRTGWAARGSAAGSNRVELIGGHARYPDTLAGITRRTDASFVSAVWQLNDRWILRGTAEHEVRRASFSRDSLVLGVSMTL